MLWKILVLLYLEEMWRKSRGLENFPKMLLFTPLIHRNGGKESQRSIPLELSFKPNPTENKNPLRPHSSIPLHNE
jgi:hypothetical protein